MIHCIYRASVVTLSSAQHFILHEVYLCADPVDIRCSVPSGRHNGILEEWVVDSCIAVFSNLSRDGS